MLDELNEMIELHERNSLNLALCGGLKHLMTYMTAHPDAEARKMACHTFS